MELLDKTESKTNLVTRDKRYFMIIKRLTYLEDIIIINTQVPRNRTPKYLKLKLTKLREEIDNSVIIVEDFNTFDNG